MYTNADQFLNKRDLLSVQIIRHPIPDIILISEMLPKAPNVVMNLSLFALSGYSLYLNFDPDNYNSSSHIRGVGIFDLKQAKYTLIYKLLWIKFGSVLNSRD